MPINIEALLAYALLELCSRKSLEKITVTELLNETGTSRRAFYSRFRDKNDLICWIYREKIVKGVISNVQNYNICFMESPKYFSALKQYQLFIFHACKIVGQNCLQEYMLCFATDYLLKQAQICGGVNQLPDELVFAIEYHAYSMVHMCIKWILSGMPTSPEEISARIHHARITGCSEFLL